MDERDESYAQRIKSKSGIQGDCRGDGGGTYGTAQSALLSMRVGAWPSRDPLGPG